MKARKIVGDYTIFGILNQGLFQWLGVRIGYMTEKPPRTQYKRCESSVGGEISALTISYPVVPLTGWWSDYRHFGFKPRHRFIWNKK